ncbi:MAG: hypothetical protein MJZ42_01155 [Bacteroidales bacterium]|nr:hypothetical protein [Bacteroidales bacterium]
MPNANEMKLVLKNDYFVGFKDFGKLSGGIVMDTIHQKMFCRKVVCKM